MRGLVTGSGIRATAMLLSLGIGLIACTPASSQPAASNGAPGTSIPGGPAASGEITVEGSVTSSGLYDATWTWEAGNAADPGFGGITVTSDKGTFGSIAVLNDGSITFTSGAPELDQNARYEGSGAQVQVKDDVPCAFTLDNDVTGSTDGGVVHLKGSLTIHGGAFNC